MKKKIGRYEIVERLGAGGMGVVYKAFDPKLGRDVAIKILSDNLWDDPEAKERFKREARALAAFSHKNITTIYDVEEEDGRLFIVMEYLDGTNLRTIIKQKYSFPLYRKLNIAAQIAEGLSMAHAHEVVHRDVKPANVMVTEDGQVKLHDSRAIALRPASWGACRPYRCATRSPPSAWPSSEATS